MPRRRRWDDPWQRYPASKPLPAEGGLATTKQRGAMAATWWSKRFTDALESYGLGARMQRGRRYARTGQVLGLDVRAALIASQVQGSRRTPYLVTISLPEPSAPQWEAIEAAMRSKVGFVAHLLAGEVPPELDDVFASAGVALLPGSWSDVRASCSCPDWENPCKHIAAVLYVFALQLDDDPWLLLAWRGRTREQILAHHTGSPERPVADRVAPWWPFPPGRRESMAAGQAGQAPPPGPGPGVASADPAGVLSAVEPLEVQIGATPVVDLLVPAYQAITRDRF